MLGKYHAPRTKLMPGEITEPGDSLHPKLTDKEREELMPVKEKIVEKQESEFDKLMKIINETNDNLRKQTKVLQELIDKDKVVHKEILNPEKTEEQIAAEKLLLKENEK